MTNTDLPARAAHRSPGRPLSPELSEQLVAVAVDILADEGWGRLNSDRVAARARAGKAGIYRRWPTMSALVRHAVGGFELVACPEDTGSLRGDLVALLQPWTQELSREERAAAGLVGAARHDDELRAGLDAAVVQPLAAVLDELARRSGERGEPVAPERLALLRTLVQALWWERYTAFSSPLSGDEVTAMVDRVLLPAVTAPAA
ncbi:TetR-like C-terminal domain-containing protein [Klenkia sp. PcliD-1-E]|uniref:TetR-like C-terminal domain-containing protein n=1 Tax=Klenkia sp. PcliD-1-E TaxID=2954492 RepID=UPI002096AACA|nr:TetR-like C-terminal domain-containing protein [Klenkia sp. PcliD-1-E]MCO7220189.1 TetR/AcrR family transcriptional regulator C-terminal ligand-binding domain-containing protein [Klenkia sp. PcliD-1-E]